MKNPNIFILIANTLRYIVSQMNKLKMLRPDNVSNVSFIGS